MTDHQHAGHDDRFAGHPRLGGHDPSAGTDTGGVPWTGREVTSIGFEDDRGDADPAVIAALEAVAACEQRPVLDVTAREKELLALLVTSRFLVPVVAAPEEVDDTGPLAVEKTTDMATVTLTAPDGTTALPVFTSVAALAQWDATARPVPVTAVSAAQGAIEDGCAVLLVDLGARHGVVLRSSMLWALAQERTWEPPYADPVVRATLGEAAAAIPDVRDIRTVDGAQHASGLTVVELTLPPDLGQERVEQIVTTLGEALSEPDTRIRLDDLAFSIRPVAN